MSEKYKYQRFESIEPITKLHIAADRATPPFTIHSLLTKSDLKDVWSAYFNNRQMKPTVQAYGRKQSEAINAFTARRLAHENKTLGTFIVNAVNGTFLGWGEIDPQPYLGRRNSKKIHIPFVPKRFSALSHPLNVILSEQVTPGPFIRVWTTADNSPDGQAALSSTYAALSDPEGIASDFYASYARSHPTQAEPIHAYTFEPIHNATHGTHNAIRKAGLDQVNTGYYADSKSVVLPAISRLYTGPALDI